MNTLDPDNIRERLAKFLDKEIPITPSAWAALMGITHVTMYNLLHGACNPRRATLVKVKKFLDEYKGLDYERKKAINSMMEIGRAHV